MEQVEVEKNEGALHESGTNPIKQKSNLAKGVKNLSPDLGVTSEQKTKRKDIQITFKEGNNVGVKERIDNFLALCNQREDGPKITYAQLVDYAIRKLVGKDVSVLHQMYRDPEIEMRNHFQSEFGRSPKGKEIFQFMASRYETKGRTIKN